jgi:transposase
MLKENRETEFPRQVHSQTEFRNEGMATEQEEQLRAIHRQREQLVKARKQLEAQGRSLMVNYGIEAVQSWWKPVA